MHTDENSPDPTAVPVGTVISPVEPKVDVVGEVPAEPEPPAEPVYCRHCGEEAPAGTVAEKDWLCGECGRYQHSAICPTCHSVVTVSLLPAEMVPEPHAPKKRKKAKE
jgi:rRNA maturation protein Nop10